jgi:hypothetical protein
MATMNAHVWHDVTGRITAVGHPVGGAKCVPLGNENQSVLEVQVDEKDLAQLHETHSVDSARRSLTKNADYQKKP